MTISKCEHGKYLDMCRICFPLPEPSEAINKFAEEMTKAFYSKSQNGLSDFEIVELYNNPICRYSDNEFSPIKFARAILKKASEK